MAQPSLSETITNTVTLVHSTGTLDRTAAFTAQTGFYLPIIAKDG